MTPLPGLQAISRLDRGLLPSLSTPNLRQLANLQQQQSTDTTNGQLQQELAKKDKQIQLIQSAYWQLQSDFDNACNLIKQQHNINNNNDQQQQQQQQNVSSFNLYKKLDTISEQEDEEFDRDSYEQALKEKDEEKKE